MRRSTHNTPFICPIPLATRKAWGFSDGDWKLLRWAARSHEIGMAIAHRQYQRHGAYLLRNADLPGFSQNEQETLALLVWCHRRKLSPNNFAELNQTHRTTLLRLTVLLRLACLFKHVEQLEYLPEFRVAASNNEIQLQFPVQWIDQHPLTTYELKEEQHQLARLDIQLKIS